MHFLRKLQASIHWGDQAMVTAVVLTIFLPIPILPHLASRGKNSTKRCIHAGQRRLNAGGSRRGYPGLPGVSFRTILVINFLNLTLDV
jgi:hypothetical protein